jgi:hypothetical protein
MWICGLGSRPKLIVSTQGSKAFPSLESNSTILLAQYSSDATQHLYTKFGLVNAIGTTNKLTQNLMLVKGTRVK